MKTLFRKSIKTLKSGIFILGIIAIVMLFLSFTDIPYLAYHKLGTTGSKLSGTPTHIVLFGGSGMPTPDGLIRAYYTAEVAKKHDSAKIIIASPDELTALRDTSASYTNELLIRGIDTNRIQYDTAGYNTFTQAKQMTQLILSDTLSIKKVMVVTSPEHMYRSVKCLIKAGIDSVGGIASFELPIEEAQLVKQGKLTPLEKEKLNLRYNIWSYLNYELVVMREYLAIGYYMLRGRI